MVKTTKSKIEKSEVFVFALMLKHNKETLGDIITESTELEVKGFHKKEINYFSIQGYLNRYVPKFKELGFINKKNDAYFLSKNGKKLLKNHISEGYNLYPNFTGQVLDQLDINYEKNKYGLILYKKKEKEEDET